MRMALPGAADLDGAIWRYDAQSPRFAEHHHDELELNLVLSGRAAYLVGGQRVELQPRTLLWLLPRQAHFLIDISDDFDMWVAAFRRRLVTRVCVSEQTRGLRAGQSRVVLQRKLSVAHLQRLSRLIENVLAETGAEPWNAGLGYVLAQAASVYALSSDVVTNDRVHPAVERAAYLMSREPALSATDLAERCGLSSARLGRLFRAQVGQPLVTFRNRQRIAHVLSRFDPKQHTWLTLALDAGFGSYPQFHRVFRDVVGCAPADYQRVPATPRGD